MLSKAFKTHKMLNTCISRYINTMVVVRYLPKQWEVSDIIGKFNERKITKINFIKNKDGEKTGKAIFHLRNEKDAKVFIKDFHEKEILGKKIHLELYESKPAETEEAYQEEFDSFNEKLSRRVYVQNIPDSATRDDVFALFSNFSDSFELKMPFSSLKKHNGFALVYLDNPDHVASFINYFDKADLFENELKVSMKLKSYKKKDTTQISDKIEYYDYIKRKYNSTLKDPGLDKIPTLKGGISKYFEGVHNETDKKLILDSLMKPDDNRLSEIAKESVHRLTR